MGSSTGNNNQQVDSYRRKSILMLATLMATATYVAGFSPPGGVWQDTGGHLPGDPIMRSTHYGRYVVFFYFNAAAFALSLMVVVLTLVLTAFPKNKTPKSSIDWLLWLPMLTATLAFMAAYCTGACRDKFRVVVFCVLVAIVLVNVIMFQFPFSLILILLGGILGSDTRVFHKLMPPLSMFALTIAYVGGLSTPGGFWDSAEGGHRPGDEILHGKLLHLFSYFNIGAFVSSLYSVSLVMCGEVWLPLASVYMMAGQLGLIVSYTVGSSRGRHTSVSVICSLCAAIGAYIMLHVLLFMKAQQAGAAAQAQLVNSTETVQESKDSTRSLHGQTLNNAIPTIHCPGSDNGLAPSMAIRMNKSMCCFWNKLQVWCADVTKRLGLEASSDNNREQRRRASLVQLLAGLAVSITYQAGLYPPGGVWQDGHKAGDPILLTTNAQRYKAFFYCNTVAFVASLLAIFLAQKSYLNKHHALEAAMILDLLGLIVAYAIGSCRDQISSMYAVGIAGAAVVYVVVHVQYFTLGSPDKEEKPEQENDDDQLKKREKKAKEDDDALVDKKGGRFLLFAILVSSITYQAGLTPPGGFLLQDDIQSGHRAGDPVLLYNYPRRYKAFFYCNSVSFMLSIVLILLLVNPNMYRPAIRSHALSLCSAVSFICLISAFAAGSTQHLETSICIFVLAAVAFFLCLFVLLTIYWRRDEEKEDQQTPEEKEDQQTPEEKKTNHDPETGKKIYLMTLAILVGSVTYQAGLDPPGGSWQSTSDGHDAGNPVMQDNRRDRYLAFLSGNSTSFVASIYLIELLLFNMWFPECKWLQVAIQPTVVAQYLGFLVAYAAGSSRQWNTSAHVGTLVIAVLAYVATHVMLSDNLKKKKPKASKPGEGAPTGAGSRASSAIGSEIQRSSEELGPFAE